MSDLRPPCSVLSPSSSAPPPISSPRLPTSDLQPPTSNPQPPASELQLPTSSLQRPTSIRALFFDLDDTLLETHEAHRAAMRAACMRLQETVPERTVEELEAVFTRVYLRIEQKMEAGGLTFPGQWLFRTTVWAETLSECAAPRGLVEELARTYVAVRSGRYELFPDVVPALRELSQRYTLVVITNGLGDLQREKVEATGLVPWFPHILISGEVGSWKPDATIFRLALERACVDAAEAVMLGDSLTRDVAGAAALGIRTVWVRRYAHLEPLAEIRPDRTISCLAGLTALLDQWS